MVIRRFRAEDTEAVVTITLICFEGVSIDHAIEQRFGPVGEVRWQGRKGRSIRQDLAAHADGSLVCEIDGRVIGYITSHADQETGIGWIPNMAVLPEHQGRGIGRKLIEAVFEDFRRKGMKLAKIETLAQNEKAFRLYTKLGFEEVAKQLHLVRPL